MTCKSGFADENSSVRSVRAPGPLREVAGFSYQEFSALMQPLKLKGDPFAAGDENQVYYWAEMLMPEHAKVLATYDHPFFGSWAAITENQFGAGTSTYEGTLLSDELQKKVVLDVLDKAQLTGPAQTLPASIRLKEGTSSSGRRLRYFMNYSAAETSFVYPYAHARDLLTGIVLTQGQKVTLKPWDLVIAREE